MDVLQFIEQLNQETKVLLVLSIILFSGFIMTRLTNTLNMPKVSGYILSGILIGPCCLDFIPHDMIASMGFISDIALAFIAFGVGKFFKKAVIMKTGRKIIVITFSEALMAGVLVTLVLKALFRLDWGFALILGAIATATAPASTMMTINQYKAKGEFVNTLLQIVALDDVVCLLAFSIVSAVINGSASGSLSLNDIVVPIMYNFVVIALGVFCGYFLSRLLIPARSRDNRLILAIAMLLGLSGLCATVDISPLLSCMVFGAVYINLTRDKKLFRQINNFTPPVMSIFFIVSGMNLDLRALSTVGAVGVAYFIVRIAGKYLGTYFSCKAMGTSREIRNYMGLALIPQAGVAIGLAFLGQRVLPKETGSLMLTIILSSSVLYEMVGPISAKAALFLSGSIPHKALLDMVQAPEGQEPVEEEQESHEEESPAQEALEEKAEAFGEGRLGQPGKPLEGFDKGQPGKMPGEYEEGQPGELLEVFDEGPSGERLKAFDERRLGESPEAFDEGRSGELPEAYEGGGYARHINRMDETAMEETMVGGAVIGKTGGREAQAAVLAPDLEEIPEPEEELEQEHEEMEGQEDGEEYVEGLPELHEYNKGVDERDDYDVERINKSSKNRKGKKKKKKSVAKGKA